MDWVETPAWLIPALAASAATMGYVVNRLRAIRR